MRALIVLGAATLVALTVLAAVLGTFHDDAFYHYAYARNGAYERLGTQNVHNATENFQAYIEGEEMLSDIFDHGERAHLNDVKNIYTRTSTVARLLLCLFVIITGMLILGEEPRHSYRRLLRLSGFALLTLLGLSLILAVDWTWSFRAFHKLFFTGNWAFPASSTLMKLWGGSFFALAAGYVWLKLLAAGSLLLAAGKEHRESDAEH